MNERVRRMLQHQFAARVIGAACIVVLLVGLASLGPVGDKKTPGATGVAPSSGFAQDSSQPSTEPSAAATGQSSAPASIPIGQPTYVGHGVTHTTGPSYHAKPTIPQSSIPHFGLRTQGIDLKAKTVRVGISNNFNNCGDAASMAAANPATVGDAKKSIQTYVDYINATGGIGGLEFKPMLADDGGTCTEKNKGAAIQILDTDKDFIAIPGLHSVSDYLIDHKLPVYGGKGDPASLKRYGPNGLMLLEPSAPTYDAWASFGKYYLDTPHHHACLIRIANPTAAGDFDTEQKVLLESMDKYGLKFTDILQFADDPSTAQKQSDDIVVRAKGECDQVYFMAGNPVGLVFMTNSATQHQWFPTWTFTSLTGLTDSELGGHLMDQVQWEHAIGLTYRVPDGSHPKAGNCQKIYEDRNGSDGMSTSASAQVYCAQILTTAEIMRRAIKLTGTLNADTLLMGADAINDDFYYDATVPLDYGFKSASGPFKTRAFSHYTVIDWDSTQSKYTFPKYPCYYRTFGPNGAGCEDLSETFKKAK